MNIRFVRGTLERQARCLHTSLSKEIIFGQKTGEYVCDDCKESFMTREVDEPLPEYRKQMIVTAHALLIALKVNDNLKLEKEVESHGFTYDWALVNKENGNFVIPVAYDVAEDCIAKRYVFYNMSNNSELTDKQKIEAIQLLKNAGCYTSAEDLDHHTSSMYAAILSSDRTKEEIQRIDEEYMYTQKSTHKSELQKDTEDYRDFQKAIGIW
ncbi:hypothetical protein [Sphaerospermopsis sp. FACHB-1194]|nr:hypothetical protein [Sphaerospermopsis sp. FACHB-1194]MBD2146055.1 hypothetical protein [Sphaerospermopsis sp. FACHB-1194]